MSWIKVDNVAQYKGASWDNFIKKESNCTLEHAKEIAWEDPNITFFFICRGPMVLEGPVQEEHGTFAQGDAVFFSEQAWYGSAPQCDAYEKTGLSVLYISPKNLNQFQEIGDYLLLNGKPAVDMVVFFAGNFCTLDKYPYLRANNNTPPTTEPFNPNVQEVLSSNLVSQLQAKGIKVLMSVLNGHTSVGWSQFTSKAEAEAEAFAQYLRDEVVDKYGLDGIDIDDEYSNGEVNYQSLAMVSTKIKAIMPNKLLTKALFSDSGQFQAKWQGHSLAENLDYGWYMVYNDPSASSLDQYVALGMAKEKLLVGFSAENQFAKPTAQVTSVLQDVGKSGFAGGMVFNYENTTNSIPMMEGVVNGNHGNGNWNKS